VALHPDYIGFICYPWSSRFVGDRYETWVAGMSDVKKTGVFIDAPIREVKISIKCYGFQALQLHGSETPAYCAELTDSGVEIIKAFGIGEQFDWTTLDAYETVVDHFLFDTKSPQHGGTGKRFNWALLEHYTGNKPYFLSGGISADNM